MGQRVPTGISNDGPLLYSHVYPWVLMSGSEENHKFCMSFVANYTNQLLLCYHQPLALLFSELPALID